MKKLINLEYLPLDNSYAQNLTDPKSSSFLAGFWGELSEMTLIKSNPFTLNVKSQVNCKMLTHKFIMVEDSEGNTHMVLFFPFRVVTPENKDAMISMNEEQAYEQRNTEL